MTGRPLPPGIERTRTGYRAYVCVTQDHDRHRRSKRFPADTPIETMTDWRRDTDAQLRSAWRGGDVPLGVGFLADADRYLAAVQAMPTYTERRRHIQQWAAVFGDRP